jgi:hypothetical protein
MARHPVRALLLIVAMIVATVGSAGVAQAADYTQGVRSTGPTSATFWFTPAVPSTLVDVHYTFPGQSQQDFRMTQLGSTWEKPILQQISAGTVVTYWFTYNKNGVDQGDTPHFTYTHNGSGGPGPGPNPGGPGTFPLILENRTNGAWSDSQIYLTILGMATPGEWSYLKPNGVWTHINYGDTNAPGHLTKDGRNFPNMSFSLAQTKKITMPTRTEGGRVYLSLGSPLFIPVSPDNRGWGGPDLRNPTDPNRNVYYDWYEFTYIHGQVAYGGNTTQVDQFSFPLTAHLVQTSSGFDSTLGITRTRSQVFSGYQSFVSSPYKGLANTYRIVAPRTANAFQPGGPQGNLMQGYIDQVWSKFSAQQWTQVHDGRKYTGRIVGGVLTGTKDDGSPFRVAKPNSTQVFECSGPLALGNDQGGSDTTREVGRDFCAAFHRGVALNPADWYNPARYYQSTPRDDYSAYLHTVSLGGKAYAFAYDDVNNQSSVQILGNANPPTSLTLGIGW